MSETADISAADRETVAALWRRATERHGAGDLDEAVGLYRALRALAPGHLGALNFLGAALCQRGHADEGLRALESSAAAAPQAAALQYNLAAAYGALGRMAAAEAAYRRTLAADPNHRGAAIALALCLIERGAAADAARQLERVRAAAPDDDRLLDALARAHFEAGDEERARAAGAAALAAKDRLALARPSPLGYRDAAAPPPPSPETRALNVISFSLWGRKPRYLRGALENARRAAALLPEWTTVFYCDEAAAAEVGPALTEAGAVMRAGPPAPGETYRLFWRFLPAEDAALHRFLSRDADCRIGPREAAAVRAWVASERPFHVMRDHVCHTELILAGLWGGWAGRLTGLRAAIDAAWRRDARRWIDQHWLRGAVWPLLRERALIHDGVYALHGARPFPQGPGPSDGPLSDPPHVGASYLLGPDAASPGAPEPATR